LGNNLKRIRKSGSEKRRTIREGNHQALGKRKAASEEEGLTGCKGLPTSFIEVTDKQFLLL